MLKEKEPGMKILIKITYLCIFPLFIIFNLYGAGNSSKWLPIKSINTRYHEFSPTISPDGKYLIFASSRPGGLGDEDLWISYFTNNEWTQPLNLTHLNSRYHDYEPFITYDGNALLFSSDRDGGYGVGDLYVSYKSGNTWGKPINLGPIINTKDSEKMPSASIDNKEIYFARIPVDYKKGKLKNKRIQIYVSTRKKGKWQTPELLPAPVNQMTFDCAPRIMPDNKSMLFCSARDGGMGSYDIWMVKRKNRHSDWTSLTNLSHINTPGNEVYFAFTVKGDRLYMAARWDLAENYDIYEYIVDKQIIEPTITLQGRITNINTGESISAYITVELFTNVKEHFKIKSDKKTGKYSVTLPHGGNYSVTVEAPGYMFYSEKLDLTELANSDIINKNIGLHPLKKGENIIIHTIYFDPDSYNLREESKIALNRIVRILTKNPNIKLLIKGHVAKDAQSTVDSQWLSEQRAKAVKNYLVEQGIKSSRLKTKGYGNTMPIGDNKTAEGKKLNRRTEFEIL